MTQSARDLLPHGRLLHHQLSGPALNTEPLVSVVIPTYNHERFIRRTLDSVLHQSFKDFEIIVVNDGSPDDTRSQLQDHIDTGRIRYIEQANAGQANARNHGLRLAQGKYIAFLDDDDLWPPRKLMDQVAFMELEGKEGVVALGGEAERIDEDDQVKTATSVSPYSESEISFVSLFGGNPFVSPGQTLIRTEAIRSIGGFDESIWGADDFDIWFRLAEIGSVFKVGSISLHYRLHGSNASKQYLKMFKNTQRVVNKHIDSVPESIKELAVSRANYFLYLYGIQSPLGVFWSKVRRGDPSCVRLLGQIVPVFFRIDFKDSRILKSFMRDLVPVFR